MELIEWTGYYIDNLNAFKRDLESKEVKNSDIHCTYKGKGLCIYHVLPTLNETCLDMLEGHSVIVCLNTKQNIDFVAKNWEKMVKNPNLKLIFSNPDLNLQWSLVPRIHDMVSDTTNLKSGLKSIASAVPEV